MSYYKYKFQTLPHGNQYAIKMLHSAAHSYVRLILLLVLTRALTVALTPLDTQELIELLTKQIKLASACLLQLLFAMQKQWGFPQDVNKHTWWLKPSCCTCPKLDNTDPVYFGGGKIIALNCPVHGKPDFTQQATKEG